MITVNKHHSEHFSAFQECKGERKRAAVVEAEMDLSFATVLSLYPLGPTKKEAAGPSYMTCGKGHPFFIPRKVPLSHSDPWILLRSSWCSVPLHLLNLSPPLPSPVASLCVSVG